MALDVLFFLLFTLPLLLLLVTASESAALSSTKKDVLVLGGNGFLGVYAVEALAQSGRYTIAIANRNSSYFDSAERLAATGVVSLHWDRRHTPFGEAPEVRAYLATRPLVHAIIDFSCYNGAAAQDVATYLLEANVQVEWYVYISSDSIYEVGSPKAHPEKPTEEGIDDHRPSSLQDQAELNASDPYAHGKLEAEEVLQALQPASSWSYVFLRIPDVVGPRDTSYRWWLYQILLKLQSRTQVPVPYVQEDRDGRRMSLVYVKDVARAILQVLTSDDKHDSNMSKRKALVKNTALNLANDETWTFPEIMECIALEVAENTSASPQPPSLRSPLLFALNMTTDFPSVKKGPILTTRARALLGWEPTPWVEILHDTVEYFESEAVWHDARFVKEREGVLRMALQQVAKYEKQEEFFSAIREVYELDVSSVDIRNAGWKADVIVEDAIWTAMHLEL
jgi:nucleoside-diphosphate-sugar epimerase